MNADNQQERPNYRIHYDIIVGDLCTSHERAEFFAPNNEDAHKKANDYVNKKETFQVPVRLVDITRIDSTGLIVEKIFSG